MVDFSKEEFDEILNIFLDESDEITKRLNSTLVQLENQPDNIELLNILFRNAHSLKGASRMVGFNNVQNLAHKIEDVLELASEKKLDVSKQFIDILIHTVDEIRFTIEQSVAAKKEIITQDYTSCLEKLDNLKSISSNKNENKIAESFDSPKNETKEDVEKTEQQFNNLKHSDTQNNIQLTDVNWQNIFTSISEINRFISEVWNNLNKYKIFEITDMFNKLYAIFDSVNFNYETDKIFNIISKFNFIENASNILVKDDIDFVKNEMEKIENNVRQRAIASGVSIIGGNFNENKIQNDEISEMLLFIEKNIIESETDFLKISQACASIEHIIDNPLFVAENKHNILKKIQSILMNFLNKKLSPDSQTVEIIISIIEIIRNDKYNTEDAELIMQRLFVLEQTLEFNSDNSQYNLTVQSSKSMPTFEKLDDFINKDAVSEIKTLRVDTSKLDKLVNQVGELITNKIKTKTHIKDLINIQDDFEFWHAFSHKSLNYIKYYERKMGSSFSKNDIESANLLLRQLFNVFKDNSDKIHELIKKINDLQRKIQDDDAKMTQIISELEIMVKNIRVLPMSVVFKALPRMVRDISKSSKKEIELFIMGSDVTADKKIIEEIKSPLVHIIRNAIDHGIEPPEERERLMKPRKGKIYISAKHVENKIVIDVQDDGRGINIDKIKEKVLKKGLLTKEEVLSMTDEQIMNIIFWPGFSTEDDVTDISGRGIGLDVVQTKISSLNGKVDVTSVLSKGASVSISLPTTMATMKALVFSVCDQFFAMPMNVISHVRFVEPQNIITKNKNSSIIIKNEHISVFEMKKVLGFKDDDQENIQQTAKKQILIIIETDNTKIGYFVDKILGDQEILHTKLTEPIIKLNNISGITNLASGDLCLILNVSGLIKSSYNISSQQIANTKPKTLLLSTSLNNENLINKKILLVDDSKTSLNCTKAILKNINIDIETATNAAEAIKILKKMSLDLIITDIEMPIKNGIEFIKHLKSDENFHKIPIIVLSSTKQNEILSQIRKLQPNAYFSKNNLIKEQFIKTIFDILG